jgi:hypothetical protein
LILKIHGAVSRNRVTGNDDSYVITEDDYIDYLAMVDPSEFLPAPVLAYLKRCYFLFLGYSLRDWNLRVILNKIWDSQRVGYNHWAIQLNPADVDERFWMKRGVDIIDRPLEEYIAGLREHLPDRADAPVP